MALGLGGMAGCRHTAAPLRIASNMWPGYEPLYLARELGLLDPDRVRLIELLSATDCMQALAAGTVEGAGLTLDEVITVRAEGLELTVVQIFNFSAGADMILARPGTGRMADLAGGRIGLEQTALGALMLASALELNDMPADSVERVPLTVDEQREAFLSGQVDAVVTFEPVASQLLAAGAVRVFDSRAIPDRVVDVLAVSPAALKRSDGALRHLVEAYFTALEHTRTQPQDAAYRMAPRLGVSPQDVRKALSGLHMPDAAENRKLLLPPATALHETALRLQDIMLANGLLPQRQSLDGLFDHRFLPELEAA